jgi:hypothetical protein
MRLKAALSLATLVASYSSNAIARLTHMLTTQVNAQLIAALEHERQAAMACFADAETARRIDDFARERR